MSLSQEGVTVLVTTHYLDEAERCHRVALIHAGRLAALGTTAEVKQIFEGRPIVEVRTPQAVAAMRALDAMPDVEKTSLFGTAVHAVLAERDDPGRAESPGSRRAGLAVDDIDRGPAVARRRLSRRRRESRRRRGMRKALAVYRKELRQILRDRRTLLILVFIPALFLLLYGYALNFDIRHIALAVDDRDGTPAKPLRRLGVRQLRLLRSGRDDRTRRPRSSASST